MMQNWLERSIVRILVDGRGVGTGFLCSDSGYIVTAAHVLAGTKDQVGTEQFEVEFLGESFSGKSTRPRPVQLLRQHFFPFQKGDIAFLHYANTLPDGVESLFLGIYSAANRNLADSSVVQMYGFPRDATGSFAKGTVLGRKPDASFAFKTIQVDSRQLERGFSGSPVLEVASGKVIGLVSWLEPRNKSFIISAEEILVRAPQLLRDEFFSRIPVSSFLHQSDEEDFDFPLLREEGAEILTLAAQLDDLGELVSFLKDLGLRRYLENEHHPYGSKAYWLELIGSLQFSKVDLLIRLLEYVDRKEWSTLLIPRTLSKVVSDWQKVKANPYLFIFSPYLTQIIKTERFQKMDKVYIDLRGEKNVSFPVKASPPEIDPIAVQQQTSFITPRNFWDSFSDQEADPPSPKSANKDKTNEKKATEDSPRIDFILNIAKDEDQFILIGGPGSGKSHTLRKIEFRSADRFLNGDKAQKIPVLVIANQYNHHFSFEALIRKSNPLWHHPALDRSRFQLLIDGINEINPSFQAAAKKELDQLIADNPDVPIIISSRKYGFENRYRFPVFELKELQPQQVRQYIAAYLPQYEDQIWEEIKDAKNKKIESLAYNPLTLFMIIYTFDPQSERILPLNRGSLFRKFIREIIGHEEKFTRSRIDVRTKENLLSELGLRMRMKDFNPPILEVEDLFKKELKESEPRGLLYDLCDNFVLQHNHSKESPGNQLTIEEAGDGGTISFVHESYLEYFCALEIKRDFIRHKKLEIDILATEWFETILMSSDLFEEDEEEEAAQFLTYLYYNGQKQRYPLRYVAPEQTAKGRVGLDYERLDGSYFFQEKAVACKVAFNLKYKFPRIYRQIEEYLLGDMVIWLNYYSYQYERERFDDLMLYPLEKILAAVGGLSSEPICRVLFQSPGWQMVWIMHDQRILNRWELDERKKVIKEYNRSRVTALIANLSDFELLYRLLIEESFFLPTTGKPLVYLESVLKNQMPVKLKKRLFEKTRDIGLLERIGREDLEYFIENYALSHKPINFFIHYLISFAYNSSVQKELLDLLFSDKTDESEQISILLELLKRFYCLESVLRYIQNRLPQLVQRPDFGEIIPLLRFVPLSSLPASIAAFLLHSSRKEGLSFLRENDAAAKLRSYYLVQRKGQENAGIQLGFFLPYRQSKLKNGNEKEYFFSARARIPIGTVVPGRGKVEIVGNGQVYTYLLSSKSNKSHFTITLEESDLSEDELKSLPDSGELFFTAQNGKKYKTKFFKTADSGSLTLDRNFFPKAGVVQWENDLLRTAGYSFTGKSKIKLDFVTDKQTIEKIHTGAYLKIEFEGFLLTFGQIAVEKKLQVEEKLVFRPFSSDAETETSLVDANEVWVIDETTIHPDLLQSDHLLIQQLNEAITLPAVRELIRRAGLVHLFHEYFEALNHGIVLKLFPGINKLLYYDEAENKVMPRFFPPEKLAKYQSADLVIVEENQDLPVIENYVQSEKYGFLVSYVDTDKKDYLFIFNPRGKDFFIHNSRVDFEPEPCDVVSFYPCLNFSYQYRNYPLALRMKKISSGNREMVRQYQPDTNGWLEKYLNIEKLEPYNTYNLWEIADCYKQLGKFDLALEYAKKQIRRRDNPQKIMVFAGNCAIRLGRYRLAIGYFRKVLERDEGNVLTRIRLVNCYLQIGRIKSALNLCTAFFAENEASGEREHVQMLRLYIRLLSISRHSYVQAEKFLEQLPHDLFGEVAAQVVDIAAEMSRVGKDHLGSLKLFERAFEYRQPPQNHITYSIFLYKIGYFQRSDKQYKQGLKLGKHRPEIKFKYYRELAEINHVEFLPGSLRESEIQVKIAEAEQYWHKGEILRAAKLLIGLFKWKRQSPEIIEAIVQAKEELGVKADLSTLSINWFYQAHYKLFPPDYKFTYEFGYHLLKSKKYKEALEILEPYLKKVKPDFLWGFYSLMGQIFKDFAQTLLERDDRISMRLVRNARKYLTLAFEETDSQRLKCVCLHDLISLTLDLKLNRYQAELEELYWGMQNYFPYYRNLPVVRDQINRYHQESTNSRFSRAGA
jgi:hypothetical protein